MTMNAKELKKIPFDVHIPNLEGDGIASTIPIQVEAYTDPETGEDILTPESMDLIEKTQARHMGLMSADEIKDLRTRLDLSQEEMCELLQIGAKTYTRWESGRARPSRSMNVMLCALRDGQLSINYLRSLREPDLAATWESFTTWHHWVAQPAPTEHSNVAPPHRRPGTLHRQPAQDAQCLAAHYIWEYVHPDEQFRAAAHSTFIEALAKALRASWSEEEGAHQSTTRLPSSREQRSTFMNHRFEFPAADDAISG